jgi:transketolase C-terminal domain/subunit
VQKLIAHISDRCAPWTFLPEHSVGNGLGKEMLELLIEEGETQIAEIRR